MPFLPPPLSRDELLARHGERYKWYALIVVGLGTMAAVLATTSFSVAVPALGQAFGIGQERVQWAITGFMAALTVAMLPTPWLLDRLGFRRLFLGAIAMLALTSIAGALATGFVWVVVARVLQGVAAGLLQPLSSMVVMRLFPAHSQGRASGLLGFGIVLAPAVAPTLGGVLLDRFGWQAIFLLSVPFCVVAGGLGWALLPRAAEPVRRPFDWYGVGLLGVATLVLIECVASLRHSGLLAPWTLAQFALVAVAGGLFVRHARRAAAPIVHLGLFAERSFAMGTLVCFAYGFGLYASTYVIPVFLQSALGYPATDAGLALLPSGVALAVTIPLAGLLSDRYSPRLITIAGLLLFCASFLLLAWRGGGLSHAELIGFTVMGRIGLGLIIPALTLAMLRHTRAELLGQSSMVGSYTRQLGGVLGIAVVAVFVAWRETVHGQVPPGLFEAYSESFELLAATFIVATLVAVRMKPRGPSGTR
ncbi:hypothetical protein dqs_2437 [Azoarcus olearius]|uniref:DHA2 family efflux MFS transporter permease subunit n=1 Tax=Azoarcus sp. (strain BH72) TaxID=418699 RepID=UPI0008063F52|nr:DHA2 family efflux MFS transporter permease subunit [Azoarcus olearius]ANQ85467.1 hypothetical protein dqs_2437 [Azoarcus olearius]